jgi:uncharacterized repeat protein (TIGR01451 family)
MVIAGVFGMLGACETSNEYVARDKDHGIGTGSPTRLAESGRKPRTPPPADRTEPVRRMDLGDCSYTPDAGPEENVVGLAFPTGDIDTSALMLHQVMPDQVRRGADFDYEYHVTNITGGTLQNVAVTLESRSNLEVISASPSAMSGEGGAVWSLGDLGPCETRVINVTATAESTGQAGNCVSVSYNNALCATLDVVNPELAIEKDIIAPRANQTALRCEPFTLTYNVCNTGTGTVRGVVLRDRLPAGLTVDGSRTIQRQIGDLAAGECREVQVTVDAADTGEYCSPAMAESADGLTAESNEVCATIVEPELDIACSSRETQYINRTVDYEFEITNNGDGPAEDAIVDVSLPAGAEFVSASSGGTPSANNVVFQLGTLRAGQTRTVSVTLRSREARTLRVGATANAFCAEPASVSCETEFEGIPAIVVEMIDLVDPVEVGQQTTYRITVTNQGTAPDRDIVVRCVIPEQEEFVGATGATSHRVDGNEVTFAPVDSLPPGAEASWDLTVRATGEADVRFAVEVVSDRFTTPIRETESTNLYE